MSSPAIVLLRSDNFAGYVYKTSEIECVVPSSKSADETAKKLAIAVSPKNASAVYAIFADETCQTRKNCVSALENVGYKSIVGFGPFVMLINRYLIPTSLHCETNEFLPLIRIGLPLSESACRISMTVLQKKDNRGFEHAENHELNFFDIHSYLVGMPSLICLCDKDLPIKKHELISKGKEVQLAYLTENSETKVIWNRFNNFENRVMEICGFDFSIKYVQNNQDYSFLVISCFDTIPYRKVVEIDATKGDVEIFASHLTGLESLFLIKIEGYVLQRVKIVIMLGFDLVPKFEYYVHEFPHFWASSYVHVLSYNSDTKDYTGTIVHGRKVKELVTNVNYKEALTVMDSVTRTSTLGILIDYGQPDFSLELHKAIASCLTYYPGIQIAPLHSWLSLCFRESRLHCDYNDAVAIIDWRSLMESDKTTIIAVVKFENDQFHLYPPTTSYTKILVIAKADICSYDVRSYNHFFFKKRVYVVNVDKIDKDALFEYAWYTFTRSIGSGWVVSIHSGICFKVVHGSQLHEIDLRFLKQPASNQCLVDCSTGGVVDVYLNLLGSSNDIKINETFVENATRVLVNASIDRFTIPKVSFEDAMSKKAFLCKPKTPLSAKLKVTQPQPIVDEVFLSSDEKLSLFEKRISTIKFQLLAISLNDNHYYRWSNETKDYSSPVFKTYAHMYAAIKKEFPNVSTLCIVDTCNPVLSFEQRRFRYALQQRLGFLNVTNVTHDSFMLTLAFKGANVGAGMDTDIAAYDGNMCYLLKRDFDGLHLVTMHISTPTAVIQFINKRNALLPKANSVKVVLLAKAVSDKKMFSMFENTLNSTFIVESTEPVYKQFLSDYIRHMTIDSDFDGCLVRDYMLYKWTVVVNNLNGPYFPQVPVITTVPFKFHVDVPVGDGDTLTLFASIGNDDPSNSEIIERIDVAKFKSQTVRLIFKVEDAYNFTIYTDQLKAEENCKFDLPLEQQLDLSDLSTGLNAQQDISDDSDRYALVFRKDEEIILQSYNYKGCATKIFTSTTVENALHLISKDDCACVIFDVSHSTPLERALWHYTAVENGYPTIQFTHTLMMELDDIMGKYKQLDCPMDDYIFVVDARNFPEEKPFIYLLRQRPNGYEVQDCLDEIKILREAYPFVTQAWILGDGDKLVTADPVDYNGLFWRNAREFPYSSSIVERKGWVILPAGMNFVITWNNQVKTVHAMFEPLPFLEIVPVFIGQALTVDIYLMQYKVSKMLNITTLSFSDLRERLIVLEFNIDNYLYPSVKMVGKECLISLVLTFIDNNIRVRGSGYDGLCFPAYVSFKDNDFSCGEDAKQDLLLNPDFVIYDIINMLAYDFDFTKCNPKWHFKVHRDENGQVVVTVGNTTTYAETLFGLLIKMVIKQLQKGPNDFIRLVGIEVPHNVQVSQEIMDVLVKNLDVEFLIINF